MHTTHSNTQYKNESTRHNENDVIVVIAGLWRYGDWRHVATGCNALAFVSNEQRAAAIRSYRPKPRS